MVKAIISDKAVMGRRFKKPQPVVMSLYQDRIKVVSKDGIVIDVPLVELRSVTKGTGRISFKADRYYNFLFSRDANPNKPDPYYLYGGDNLLASVEIAELIHGNRKTAKQGGAAVDWEKALQSLGIMLGKSWF
jgi:hypothetical protein